MIKETKNFKIKEVAVSSSYPKLATLPEKKETIENVNYSLQCLQTVRDFVGLGMFILSFFRSLILNKAVKGALKSDHMEGLAVDFYCNGNMQEIANKIYNKNFPFIDKIIFYKKKNFIHLSFKREGARNLWLDGDKL
ncbi:MAG: D-Ala-D-Ala carboxypeptidase family metallohydrolase [Fusobacteriaceae bacterium]